MMHKSVNGIGRVFGGEYDTIEINGTGAVVEDTVCRRLVINGAADVKGSLRAEEGEINGAASFDKGFVGGSLTVSGTLRTQGSMEAENIRVDGLMKCKGEVNAELLAADGVVRLGSFVGDRLELRANRGGKFKLGHGKWERSRIDTVECTSVYAENLEAKVIRAQEVTLGDNCRVDVIECDGPLIRGENCVIGRIVKDETKEEKNVKNISVAGILEGFKESRITAAEAEEMLRALLGEGGTAAVSGGSIGLPNDETLRFVAAKGGRILTAREMNRRDACFTVEYQGDVLNVECRGSLQCGNVEGNAAAGDALTCGSIAGNANAGDSLNCGGDIGGNVNAGDSVTCGGSVGDSIRAGDSVRVEGDVGGSVTAGDHVNCGNVGGNVQTEGAVTCGSVEGSIRAGGNVRHG